MPVFQSNDIHIVDVNDNTKVANFDVSAITTGTERNYSYPDFGGNLVIADGANAWGGTQDFTSAFGGGAASVVVPSGGGFKIYDTGQATSIMFDVSNVSVDRAYVAPDVTGMIPVVGFSGAGTSDAASGEMTFALWTGRATAIPSTKLTNATVAGTYRISYVLLNLTGIAAGTVQLTATSTDALGSHGETSAALVLTGTGRTSGTIVVQLASGDITYSTALAGVVGTPNYNLYAKCEFIGP